MNNRILSLLLTIAVMLALTACTQSGPKIVAEPLSESQAQQFIPVAADFTVDIFKHSFAEKEGQNNLVSPLSALLALSMTANGAGTETLSEMETVLGRGLTIAELNPLLSAYIYNLPSHEGSKLNIANSIWLRNGFDVRDEFLQVNRAYYAAEIKSSPFDEKTVNDINQWVDRETYGMITKILDQIPPDVIMYLINAIAFDSEWEKIYEEQQVREHDFTAFDGRGQTTKLMWSSENLFLSDEKATGFIKPYKGGAYSFAALLPNEGVEIVDYIAEMTGQSLMNTLNDARGTTVTAALPKFTYEFDIEMNKFLSAMGMPSAFDSAHADFSNLGVSPGGNIYINRVLHKTFIEVDERGTKAAAVTKVEIDTTSAPPPPPEVILDRPFVYAIIDNATNLPVFIGALLEIP